MIELYESRISAAESAGVSADMLSRYMRGGSQPSFSAMANLVSPKGISLEWLAYGSGPMRLGDVRAQPLATHSAFEEEFALVSRKAIEVSAGHGAAVNGEEHRDHLAFRRKWLKQRGFKADDLVAVVVKGDSMSPTLSEGDTVLVHTIETRVTDGIYVIRIDGDIFVKRLQHRFGGAIGVISDNKDYPDQELSGPQLNELTIIGRVVWMGGMM